MPKMNKETLRKKSVVVRTAAVNGNKWSNAKGQVMASEYWGHEGGLPANELFGDIQWAGRHTKEVESKKKPGTMVEVGVASAAKDWRITQVEERANTETHTVCLRFTLQRVGATGKLYECGRQVEVYTVGKTGNKLPGWKNMVSILATHNMNLSDKLSPKDLVGLKVDTKIEEELYNGEIFQKVKFVKAEVSEEDFC